MFRRPSDRTSGIFTKVCNIPKQIFYFSDSKIKIQTKKFNLFRIPLPHYKSITPKNELQRIVMKKSVSFFYVSPK